MSGTTWQQDVLDNQALALEAMDAATRVAWALETFGPGTVIASSFSLEDVALIALALDSHRAFRVVALDTGRLHEETRQVAEEVRTRLGVVIDWVHPGQAELAALVREGGQFSFRESLEARKRCCEVRKVRPLRRELALAPAWMTGLRRSQGLTRSDLPVLEKDQAFGGLPKVNPLFDWSDQRLEVFTHERRLPRNPLYQAGYTSIGCAPCTRATAPGEHPRAGRWWWEDPDHSECGLHPVKPRRQP